MGREIRYLILGRGVVDIKMVLEIKVRFEQFHLKNLNKDLTDTTLSLLSVLCHLKTESLHIKHLYVPKYEMLTRFTSKLQSLGVPPRCVS